MKKIILLIGILVGLPLSMVAQDDMYFFSSPKKEEKKTVQPKKVSQNQNVQQTSAKRQQMSVFIPNEGSATVVIMDDKNKDLSEVDVYNRRGGSVIIEDDYQDPYAVQGRDGEWMNNGFQGNLNDFYDAEIAIKTRNPRYRVSVSSPLYWDAVYGLNSTDWNIYVDNFDAYIFPTFSNPAWSSWKFGPRYSFSFAFGRNSYWGGYYNSWGGSYYDPWYGWGGYYDPWYNRGYYNSWYGGYYPGYWGGGYYGGYYPGYWGGGYYGREYRNGRPVYRDNRRYESSSSSSRNNYGRQTATNYRPSRTTRGNSSYNPSTSYRPSIGGSTAVSNGVRVRSSSTTVRTSPARENSSYSRTPNSTSNPSRGNYYTRPSNTSTNSNGYTRPSRVNTPPSGTTRPSSTNGRSNYNYTRSSRTNNSSSYSRPSSTRSNSYNSGTSSSSYSRSSSTTSTPRSTSTSSGGGSSRTTRGR